jgi:hypothetical protein
MSPARARQFWADTFRLLELSAAKRYDDALTLAVGIAERFPGQAAESSYLLGCAYNRAGHDEEALRTLENPERNPPRMMAVSHTFNGNLRTEALYFLPECSFTTVSHQVLHRRLPPFLARFLVENVCFEHAIRGLESWHAIEPLHDATRVAPMPRIERIGDLHHLLVGAVLS